MPRIPAQRPNGVLGLAPLQATLQAALAEAASGPAASDAAAPAAEAPQRARMTAPLPMVRSEAAPVQLECAAGRSLTGLRPPSLVASGAVHAALMRSATQDVHPNNQASPQAARVPASRNRAAPSPHSDPIPARIGLWRPTAMSAADPGGAPGIVRPSHSTTPPELSLRAQLRPLESRPGTDLAPPERRPEAGPLTVSQASPEDAASPEGAVRPEDSETPQPVRRGGQASAHPVSAGPVSDRRRVSQPQAPDPRPVAAERTHAPVRLATVAQPTRPAQAPAASTAPETGPRTAAAASAPHMAAADVMRPAEPDRRRREETDRIVDRWLAALLAEPSRGGPGIALQTERAGVVASFILNASLIPGWPPPRPFVAPSVESLVAGLARKPGGLEALMAGLLPKGQEQTSILRRVGRRLARLARSRRLRMFLGLAVLLTAIAALEAELLRLAGELRDKADTEDQPPMMA